MYDFLRTILADINKNKGKITTTTEQAQAEIETPGKVASTTTIPANYDLKYKLTLIPKSGSIRRDR